MVDAVSSFAQAAAAYARASKGEDAQAGDGAPNGGQPFASMVKSALEDAASTAARGEQASISALSGKADLSDVVTAVAEAEVTLQTVVSIRDKMIEAYKDIIRMPM
jgi:flagellar hook-basal body complex protein FliE